MFPHHILKKFKMHYLKPVREILEIILIVDLAKLEMELLKPMNWQNHLLAKKI